MQCGNGTAVERGKIVERRLQLARSAYDCSWPELGLRPLAEVPAIAPEVGIMMSFRP